MRNNQIRNVPQSSVNRLNQLSSYEDESSSEESYESSVNEEKNDDKDEDEEPLEKGKKEKKKFRQGYLPSITEQLI